MSAVSMSGDTGGGERALQLAAALKGVQERIARSCASAGRPADSVLLVAVTKTWPASDVRLLAQLGVADVAESREQEAGPKHDACADLGLRWHFVGQLQRNKAVAVARWAHCVESVDREPLVAALGRAMQQHEEARDLAVLVQVDLETGGGNEGEVTPGARRGGARPDDVPRLADLVDSTPGLALHGLMAVAPRAADPAAAFARLALLAERVRVDHPHARVLSAGMSSDLEAAVAAGATQVRIGSALLGNRPPLR